MDSATSCSSGFRDSSGNLNVVGGTSAAAPTLAAVFALLEQKLGGGSAGMIGNANPEIYGMANSSYYNNIFHDVTTGNNDSPCQQGTPNCPNGGSIGYNATTGYDLATGWGSLDVYNFVTKWNPTLIPPTGTTGGSSSSTLAISNVSVTTSAQTCSNSSGSIPLTIAASNASGSGAAPTGTVQILVDNAAVTGVNPTMLSNGTATLTLNTSSLSSGGHTVAAVYSGDGTYAPSKGSLYVDITSSQKDFALTSCTATASATSGTAASALTFTLTPTTGFTGSVSLTAYVTAYAPPANVNVGTVNNPSYVFNPATVTIGGSSPVTTSLVLNAFQSNSSGTALIARNTHPTSRSLPWTIAGSGASLACVLLLTVPRRRRWGALFALLLSVAAISISGCGSSSSSTSGSSGSGSGSNGQTNATRGTYTVNVTAVSGSSVHTSVVTFTVN